MNDLTLEELKKIKEINLLQGGGIVIEKKQFVFSPEEADELSDVIKNLYDEDRSSEIVEYADDPNHWLTTLELNLLEDLQNYCVNDDNIKRCAIAFLPNLKVNASQRGAGITLSYGMIHMFEWMAMAIMLENDCPDQGKPAYLMAKNIFSVTSAQELKNARNAAGNIGMTTELIAKAGAAQSLILRFIALHEFGHITFNHSTKHVANSAEKHKNEHDADIYAIEQLHKKSTSKEVMWNNALFICGYFYLLSHIEDEMNKIGKTICTGHPHPQIRAKKIEDHLINKIGKPQNDLFIWLNIIFNKWKEGYMTEINFSIYSQNSDEILKIFEGDDELVADGIRVKLIEIDQHCGMIVDESTINCAIDIVRDVPIEMIARYISFTFIKGKNVLRFGEKIIGALTTIDELVKILKEILKKDNETCDDETCDDETCDD